MVKQCVKFGFLEVSVIALILLLILLLTTPILAGDESHFLFRHSERIKSTIERIMSDASAELQAA